jgi:hypothetical protein
VSGRGVGVGWRRLWTGLAARLCWRRWSGLAARRRWGGLAARSCDREKGGCGWGLGGLGVMG